MKKLPISLFIVAVVYLSMTFFVGNLVEKEIKITLSENIQPDISVELLSYEREFFSATATSMLKIKVDPETTITLNVSSRIFHYPYQAVIKSNMQIADEYLSNKAQEYFSTPNWIYSEEVIDLTSHLKGLLTVVSGKYESGSESLMTDPLLVSYEMDLNNKSGDIQLDWSGIIGSLNGTAVELDTLQLNNHIGELDKQNNYELTIKKVNIQQGTHHSLLEDFLIKGNSKQGKEDKTVDTNNEIVLRSYQLNDGKQRTFTDNRIKFALTGLYQPALELLNSGSDDSDELEKAFIELIYNGAQVTLSELKSQTPWGKVDGQFDFTLDSGASLESIATNPYILFDYISGDASLVLPISLLDEPILAEPLQMGVMTGFLAQEEKTLNFETTFQQGELVVNGRVIPL